MIDFLFQRRKIKSYVFKINWAWLLTIAIFWLFAICGYPSGTRINETFLNIFIVFSYAYLVINYDSADFHSFFEVNLSTLTYLIIFLFLAFILNFAHLSQSLWGDQIYHANFSSRHAQLFIYYAENNLPEIWKIIRDISASYIVSAVNLALIFLMAVIFYVIPKSINLSKSQLALLMTLVMIAVRYFVKNTHLFDGLDFPPMLNSFGIVDPHPLFRAFPLVVTTSFFGGNNLGFRVASFVTYLLFLFFFFNRLKPVVSESMASVATVAVGTIPIFWSISYLVEQSIWSTIATSVIFTVLATSKKLEEEPLIPLFAVVILATFLRSPAFLGFIPLAFIALFKIHKKTLCDKKENLCLLVLLLLLMITVIVSAARGSPATETFGAFEKWLYSINNNISAIAAASVLGFMPLFFIGGILSIKSDKRIVLSIATGLFLLAASFLYYAPLTRQLWGVSRYQAEIFVPLVVCAVSIYCIDAETAKLRFNYFKFLPILFFILINLISLKNIDSRTFKPFNDSPPPTEGIKAEIEYPIKQVFDYAKSSGLENNLYYVGIYYGGFVSVLNGYSAQDYLLFSRLNQKHRDGWQVDCDKLNLDRQIKAVVIEPEANFGVIDKLLALGWIKTGSFIHSRSKHELILLTRNVSS